MRDTKSTFGQWLRANYGWRVKGPGYLIFILVVVTIAAATLSVWSDPSLETCVNGSVEFLRENC